MADIDIDPFGEHELRTEEPTEENIPLTLVTPGRSTWEPDRGEQETSFGTPKVPLSRGEILHKEYLVGEIYKLIGNKMHQRLEPNLMLFELDKDGRLYYKGKPLINRNGELKKIGVIADALGIRGLREIGYNIAKTNLKPRFVLDLLEKQAELPSSSEIAKADDKELDIYHFCVKLLTSMHCNGLNGKWWSFQFYHFGRKWSKAKLKNVFPS